MSFHVKIDLEIPDEFREHWEADRFGDSLGRIAFDIRNGLERKAGLLSGNIEAEVADMVKAALAGGEVIDAKEIQAG